MQQTVIRFFNICSLILLTLWLLGCDLFGYHIIGYFLTRDMAQQEAIKHLLSQYYLIVLLSNEYKIYYEYEEDGKLHTESIWYLEGQDQLALQEDVHSGVGKRWAGVDHTRLKKLKALTKQCISMDKALGEPMPL